MHVWVRIEGDSDHREEICVEAVAAETYRVLVPPAMAEGLAVGDEFRIDGETLRPIVVRRSGNVTVWLYPEGVAPGSVATLVERVEAIEGVLEGQAFDGRVWIFTIPVAAGFDRIEAPFQDLVAEWPEAKWLFGNVYDEDGETPLGWWASEDAP
jgi:hypothetical protein